MLQGGGPFVDEPPPADTNTESVDIVLTIDAAGTCTLDGKAVEREKLGAEFRRVLQANPAMLLVIEADKGGALGHVTSVQAAAREAGIHRIALAVEVVEEAPDEAAPDSD
jgi:biopolymer transport protein ExbD